MTRNCTKVSALEPHYLIPESRSLPSSRLSTRAIWLAPSGKCSSIVQPLEGSSSRRDVAAPLFTAIESAQMTRCCE